MQHFLEFRPIKPKGSFGISLFFLRLNGVIVTIKLSSVDMHLLLSLILICQDIVFRVAPSPEFEKSIPIEFLFILMERVARALSSRIPFVV